MTENTKSKLMLILSAIIFGTVGVFRRYIPLDSGIISLVRAVIGSVFLILFVLVTRKKLDFKAIRKNIVILIVSGALIAFNWILLFEAYNHTTIATATVCSYMAPIFVIIASPFVIHEKLILKKVICIAVAMVGIVLVSGIIKTGFNISEIKGALFALGGATLYASAVLCNKKMGDIGAYEKTIVQLLSAVVVLIPYVIVIVLNGRVFIESTIDVSPVVSYVMLGILGVVHTGITYALYFSSISRLDAQSIAIFSYVDPIVAVVLSITILGEKIMVTEIIGAVLILGATFVSEFNFKKKK